MALVNVIRRTVALRNGVTGVEWVPVESGGCTDMDKRSSRTRRRAIVLLGACAVSFPSLAQTSTPVYRLGFLVPRSAARFEDRMEAFRAGMRELGYAEGKNLLIEWRFADGQYDRLPMLATELVNAKI